MRDLLEAARRVEARGQFVGERLVVDKAVCAGRADGLFVEPLGVELAAFDACDLRADQRGAVLEILRAVLRPDLELPVVGGQSLEMLLPLVGGCGIAGCRAGQRAIEVDIPPSRTCDGDVQSSRCAFDDGIDGRRIVAGKEARLQLADPVPALGQRQIRVTGRDGARTEAHRTAHRRRSRSRRQSREASGSARAAQ